MPVSLLVSVHRCLGLSLSQMPPPPSAASRQVLPPALPLQSPGLRPSCLGCRGQGWGLLLALTGPSWGQERRELSQPQHSPTPGRHSSCLSKFDSCREFPRAPVPHRALSPFSCCCPSPGWLMGVEGACQWGQSGREGKKGRTERDKDEEEKQMGKTEKGVQEWGPSAPACLGSRCQ